MSGAAEEFYSHIGECERCGSDGTGFRFCPDGRGLLLDADDELPEGWQREARRILERDQREREAEANFRYYADTEEI